jgi:hypothetical protein
MGVNVQLTERARGRRSSRRKILNLILVSDLLQGFESDSENARRNRRPPKKNLVKKVWGDGLTWVRFTQMPHYPIGITKAAMIPPPNARSLGANEQTAENFKFNP